MGTFSRRLFRFSVIAVSLVLGLSGVATAEVVAVVSVKSPLTDLSKSQIASLFLGNASILVGGEPMIPVDMGAGTPLRDAFYTRYAEKSPAQIRAHWSKLIFTGRGQPPMEVANGHELKKLLANNPHMIGYLGISMIDSTVRALVSP